MGFDLDRFTDLVDIDLKCPICCGVLEDALQSKLCEHIFCSKCINEWLIKSNTCPVDRSELTQQQLQNIPRIIRNLIGRLHVKCDYVLSGCKEIITLDELHNHRVKCTFNPEYPIPCPKDCGAYIPKNGLQAHDCVRDLRLILCQQQKDINTLKETLKSLMNLISEQRDLIDLNQNSLLTLTEKYDHINQSIKTLEVPIKEVLLIANESLINNDRINQNKSNEQTINGNCNNLTNINKILTQKATSEIYLSNLDRSITAGCLREYLCKNDINVISCKETLRRGWKNDYRLIIFKGDNEKILQSKLWPRGVSCFVCGEYYSTKVDGELENDISN